MFPPYPEKEAFDICLQIVSCLKNGSCRLEQLARPSADREGQGVMLGAAVCEDKASGVRKKLIALSGNRWHLCFNQEQEFELVPSVVSPSQIDNALARNDAVIHELTDKINSCLNPEQKAEFISKRSVLTTASLSKVHELYNFHCADGRLRSLSQICAVRNKGHLPPTGTGDCAAPKLLDYAFSHSLVPLSMAEVMLDVHKLGCSLPVPPCDSRCAILIPEMLGLEILYRDDDIVVVNKQSGLLSVPGRTPDKQDCIVNRFRRLFPDALEQPAVHRLDMETSGIMVLAFNREAHRAMNRQFEDGLVSKQYEALLDGVLARKGIPPKGTMELYFRLDVDNRPHQIWDEVHGKKAVTEWDVIDVENYRNPSGIIRPVTRVCFIPHTGRTHQLRLASADSHGFGVPIIGDTLYGTCQPGERLMLHAKFIEFSHPRTGKRMEFHSTVPF